MKSYRQQKRKIIEITRKQDECKGVSVKKSANGSGQGHQKATESIRKPHLVPQIQIQAVSAKIKLQLFPINEQTRLELEKEGCNPFLELTLSPRKRISSVVKHLNTKWGSLNVAVGILVLFPYNIKLEQVGLCRRWTSNDTDVTASEVFIDVGSPNIFRLRYGWYSNLQQEVFDMPPKASLLEAHTDSDNRMRGCSTDMEIPNHQEVKNNDTCETINEQMNVNEALCSDVNKLKPSDVSNFVDDELATDVTQMHSTVPWDDNLTNLSIGGLLSEISLQGKINGSDFNSVNKSSVQQVGLISDMSIGYLFSEASLLHKMSNPSMKLENESTSQPIFLASCDISIGGLLSEASLLSNQSKLDKRTIEAGHHAQLRSPWDDNFTTLSIGGFLSEVSLQAKAGGNPELEESKPTFQPNVPLCNSFDTQLNTHSQMPKPSCHELNLSILDAEETCHAFPTRKLQPNRDTITSNASANSSGCSNGASSRLFQFSKMENENIFPKDPSCQELSPFRHPSATFMT